MAAKAVLLFCAQSLLIQSVFSQCLGRAAIDPFGWPAPGLAYDGLAPAGCGLYSPAMEFTATSGGGLFVTSCSAIPPTGISVVSENAFEGILSVAGELPFVGTTGMEGMLGTAGAGAINHACGNGLNAMSAISETSTPASVATAGVLAIAPSLAYDGLIAPGLAYDGLIAPGLAYDGLIAPGLAYDGLIAPGLAYDGLIAPGLAYDGLIAPGLVASTLGAPALGIPTIGAPAFAGPLAYDGLAYGNAAWAGTGLAYDGLACANPLDVIEITPTSGGALPVTSASAIPPTGISVASENVYEGALAMGGELPFVGTVALEGVLPTAGAGAINHACGNGRNAMISETTAFAPALGGIAPTVGGIAPAAFTASALGYRGGWAGRGCGCAL